MKTHRLVAMIPLCLIAIVVLIFFSPHLFPAQIYVASDYGGSDFTDLFWPLKSLLTQSLKAKHLPFWSDQIGTGFPILGEGEAQLFSPTTLFFLFLPLPLAFQLTMITAFLINGFGTYFLGRALKLGQTSSLLAAFAFMLSGPFVFGLEHLTIITASAFLPWAWLVVFRWTSRQSLSRLSFFPEGLYLIMVLVLQFLQASPQISLLTLFSSSLLFLLLIWPEPKNQNQILDLNQIRPLYRPLSLLLLAYFLSLTLSSIQILPSWEMRRHSNRAEPFRLEQMKHFSLTGKRLVNFIVPFALSNPSYPPAYFRFDEGPLFWETNGYVGLLTFFLGLTGLIIGRHRIEKVLSWLLLISLILAFGPKTPPGMILKYFPFSAFRVPGRFLILVDLSLVLLAATFLDQKLFPKIKQVAKSRIFFFAGPVSIVILLLDLLSYGLSYNVSVPAEAILSPPFTAQLIKKREERYLTVAGWYVYNEIYLQEQGWRGKGTAYLPFQETLFPNINLLYQVPGVSSYAGMKVKRSDQLDVILQGYFQVDTENRTAWVNYQALDAILTLTATRYLITPFYLNFPYPPLAEIAKPYPHRSLAVYRLPHSTPRAWFTNQARVITSEGNLQNMLIPRFLAQPTSLTTTALVEQPLEEIFSHQADCNNLTQASPTAKGQAAPVVIPAEIVQSTSQKLSLKLKAPECGLVVLADTDYPGWQALVDGQSTPIYRANYNFRAVPVAAGDHLITFSFQPKSLMTGLRISTASLVILVLSIGKWQLDRFRKHSATKHPAKAQSARQLETAGFSKPGDT